eukprot:gene24118-biopygen22365
MKDGEHSISKSKRPPRPPQTQRPTLLAQKGLGRVLAWAGGEGMLMRAILQNKYWCQSPGRLLRPADWGETPLDAGRGASPKPHDDLCHSGMCPAARDKEIPGSRITFPEPHRKVLRGWGMEPSGSGMGPPVRGKCCRWRDEGSAPYTIWELNSRQISVRPRALGVSRYYGWDRWCVGVGRRWFGCGEITMCGLVREWWSGNGGSGKVVRVKWSQAGKCNASPRCGTDAVFFGGAAVPRLFEFQRAGRVRCRFRTKHFGV